jgi:major vault protein
MWGTNLTKRKNNKMADTDDVRNRQRDMILAPNEYAFISDETKGDICAFVGPNKTSLAGTDRCVVFDVKTKRFKQVVLDAGIQTFQTAPEGWYIVLKNPAEGDKHPTGSGKMTTPTLRVGKKVNIPGPNSFPLWPGQMAKVIQGHNLRSNEYLLVRVYDEEAARQNWNKAVIKTQTDSVTTSENSTPVADVPSNSRTMTAEELSMGKLFMIRGTEVSFYIPPTGVEVIPEVVGDEERYVREAVSLERLEYCLLLDQNGTKRYVHGPAVVFPAPTEKFVEAAIKSNPDKAKAKKFRAQELTPASGIHVRVIADYADGEQKFTAGEELFITGKEQTIYYPREEHAIIKYGEQEIHYGLAIPVGEARYVLNRDNGDIRVVKGPQIFLADPRHEVIVNRALPIALCNLLYPGNQEAVEINLARLGIDNQDLNSGGGGDVLFNSEVGAGVMYGATAAVATPDTSRRVMIRGASKALPGDAFDRKNKFTAPRSIVLNTKFDGAVTTDIWPGYAMLLVRKNGDRRVVQGPRSVLLEYDEQPQVMTLSTGKPKSTDTLLKTVFLLTQANKVSDVVLVETRDFCKLEVKLSYRVNFEGDPEKWFDVDNYVKFLCDHMRSRIRSAVQKLGIEEFYSNHTTILRDIILGPSDEKKQRPGTTFAENGMKIYDVEVLALVMQNNDIEKMLTASQREVIQNALTLATQRRNLEHVREMEEIKRKSEEAKAETTKRSLEIQGENAKLKMELDLIVLAANAKTRDEELNRLIKEENARSQVEEIKLERSKAEREALLENTAATQALTVKQLEAEVEAIVKKAQAVSPDLIAALSAFGERAMVEKVAESMAPLGIIGGRSVIDILKKLLEGTNLAKQLSLPEHKANGTNGTSSQVARSQNS